MSISNSIETGKNMILAGNYRKAGDFFADEYQKSGTNILLHYTAIAYLLSGEHETAFQLFDSQPQDHHLNTFGTFIKRNSSTTQTNIYKSILNAGIYLKRHGFTKEAAAYIDISYLLKPANKKVLALLGEIQIRNSNLPEGVAYFVKAAKGELL